MSETPSFHVGTIPIYGRTILSPMDGFSDLPFRSLARRLGSAISYTEFVNAMDVISNLPKLEERLKYTEAERPITFQIFDDDPERLLRAALILRERDPDIIDINMGCSAKTVAGRGAGAGLLRAPEKIAAIFGTLTRELDIPVTGKIRLGWDDENQNYLEIARVVEANGGNLIAVHGRTKQQAYRGEANWQAIAEVKAAVKIPVIGNGDVRKATDIQRMLDFTGCDAVMIGRGAIGNPWIFSGLNREEVSIDQVREMMLAHLNSMLEFYGAERGLILFRKHASHYISPFGLTTEQREMLLRSQKPLEFISLVETLASNKKKTLDPVLN